MAKQIYIDSDGNEIEVSGTIATAGNLPLGSDFSDTDSTAYAINSKADKTSFTRKSYSSQSTFSVSANSIDTRTIAVNNATYGIVVGFAITNSSDVVMMQCFFNGLSEIQVRVRNIANYDNTYHLTVFYI